MAAPTVVAAGTGFAAQAAAGSSLAVPYPASGIDAGDLLITHFFIRGTAAATTPGSHSLLFGPDDGNGVHLNWFFGRIADGAEDGTSLTISHDATNLVRMGRTYQFRGSATTSYVAGGSTSTGSSSSIADADVVTPVAECLAVQFVALSNDDTIGNFTGETGGDWTEAFAEFVTTLGADGCLQLQTATMAAAGTIGGGTATAGGTVSYLVRGFAILPPQVTTFQPRQPATNIAGDPGLMMKRLGASWRKRRSGLVVPDFPRPLSPGIATI